MWYIIYIIYRLQYKLQRDKNIFGRRACIFLYREGTFFPCPTTSILNIMLKTELEYIYVIFLMS
jgi:hypothetical protein